MKLLDLGEAAKTDLLRVVGLASKTNAMLNGLQLPVDPEFDRDA